MKNSYILIEINDRNELRTEVGITIRSLNLIGLQGIDVKIDTGWATYWNTYNINKYPQNNRLEVYCEYTRNMYNAIK